MTKSARSKDDSVWKRDELAIADLKRMKAKQLYAYVYNRLKKVQVVPPTMNYGMGEFEELEDIFHRSFKVKNKDYQHRLGIQVKRLLYSRDLSDPEYLSRLFHLIELCDLYETAGTLQKLFDSKQKELQKIEGYYQPTLAEHLRLLLKRFETK
ncbi:MAG: hypothetical protein NTX82_06730 [Candidatus Parcubacteria bacterium]|nr:hypothetical protein [Candidatus Parcubacteria bacterium]